MKITKTIRKEETVEVDVTLPYFSKDNEYFYAIISEDEAIRVLWKEYSHVTPLSAIAHTNMLGGAMSGEPITAKEFEDAYEKAADYLHTKFETMRETIRERKNEVFENVTVNGEGDE